MREILFRAKRIDNGKWVEGTPYQEYVEFWKEWEWFIQTKHPLTNVPYMHLEINKKTICEFTGLTDKNGKKIFEGDIIKFHKFRGEPDWIGVVKYEHCSYIAVGRMPLAYEKRIGEEPHFCPFEVQINGIIKDTIKVIGNIHDNPELLRSE